MTEKEFREFKEDVKERLVRLEGEVSYNRRAIGENGRRIGENGRRIDENHREMQADVRRMETAVQEVRADVRVILTKLEEREKHEKRNRTVLGIIVGAASAVVSAVVSFFSTRP